jgi:hypothetical protein
VIFNGGKKWKINRRLYDNFVSRLCKGHNKKVKGRDYSRGKTDPLFFNLPSVPPGIPVYDGLKKGIRQKGVPQYLMLKPFLYGFEDKIGGLKVHIGHPHGDYIGSSEHFLPKVEFDGRCVFP